MKPDATNNSEKLDETVESLTKLFRKHPAWREAARHISSDSVSNVYFTHLPGEAWHLERSEQGSELIRGAVRDPDFVFRFSPASVETLQSVEGGLGAFALALFALIEDSDPEGRVEIRVAASFSTLMEHGFLTLLLTAGPKVAAFGLRHGVIGPRSLAKFVGRARATEPFEWEV